MRLTRTQRDNKERFVMTIKELAYSAQQHLQTSLGNSIKRSHIYELLAASFGFNSYAALGAEAVFTQCRPIGKPPFRHGTDVRKRCLELGYLTSAADITSSVLPAFLAERQIGVMCISTLVDELRGEWSYQDDEHESDEVEQPSGTLSGMSHESFSNTDVDRITPIMLEGLEAAATRGNGMAHYALALLHDPNSDGEDQVAGNSYWYSQEQQGKVLTGVAKEWADAHAAHIVQTEKYAHHLREAARRGNQFALLELADRFDEPTFFEQADSQVDADPILVADIAVRLGRPKDARKWLATAAEAGDTEAMRCLIEDYDHGDVQQCWTWLYLAELVGIDLARDEYHSINEDGSAYDDDVGGPAFADGRDGVKLAPISTEQETAARHAADRIFQSIQRTE